MTEKPASPAYPSLTAVLHAYVKQAPSGLDARTIADLVGKPYQTLMSELSRQEGHKLGADLLLPLLDAVQTDAPLEFPARQRGGVFVRIYTENISDSSLARGLAETMLKASEFFAAFAERIKDGVIDARELAAIEREGDEAVQAIMKIKQLARTAHERQFAASAPKQGA